ncbi:MAG: phospholipid-binding protein [Pegethrix bostrychoides GSE-TBD4-15B]|jgi:osmotically-inducible protein OsmY|uniref:Phospholipid-binding protein n=1 Tax=Pegethrix bostrychoides GSE-TBD4-15B TaxID=2839662 RepID=A0A951U6V1_9CYAN|nr:phospholipid-binding protein [Pegethrix bostrychoides GSE-TBD4-15B]
MGWLSRLFPGSKKKEDAGTTAVPVPAPVGASGESIPAAKVGLNGEFDESGMAKRVALAFDEDPMLDDVDTLWVAQLSSKVVLKGKVPSQQILDKMVSVAMTVDGATEVDISQVTVG